MKVFKLAVGFAAGYVLGTRAGREKFEQIAAYARKAGNHPGVGQAQEKAKTLLATGSQAVVAKLPHHDSATADLSGRDPFATTVPVGVSATTADPTMAVSTPRPARQPRPTRTTPSPIGGDPLA
ncbi:hypothetical protein [Actinoplanes sp. L3-i22]|uniref:hypothetical protein n=1 Tax=Actinoplanes sp. L3-i22 TaxID=2836373 RepID=UPI001C787768|nr:hypothetical protein [Actinoplanes sp. L3-i22]BCY09250.1 hypothetical protein L3i22_043380 [Actinoplanes sp. L3-i22]